MYIKSLAQRKFLSLLFASSLELVMIVVVFISDTIIAGHAVGENGLSAMSIIGPIVFIIFLMGCLNSFGLSFCYNSAMGNADKKRADELLGTGIIASLASGLILFVIMTLYEEQYFALMKPAPEVVNYAHEYYSFYRFVILIDPFGSLLGIMVYNDGDELLSDIANITRVAGNIVFSLFFAFVLKMGIAGVALGTIVESLTATIILFHNIIISFLSQN